MFLSRRLVGTLPVNELMGELRIMAADEPRQISKATYLSNVESPPPPSTMLQESPGTF